MTKTPIEMNEALTKLQGKIAGKEFTPFDIEATDAIESEIVELYTEYSGLTKEQVQLAYELTFEKVGSELISDVVNELEETLDIIIQVNNCITK